MNALFAPQGDVVATISRMFVHPIKSCAAVSVRQAVLTETGLAFDRAWMVVDGAGTFVTQRELPRMALVRPALRASGMTVHAPGMEVLSVSLDAAGAACEAQVWRDTVPAFDMGDPAAYWLSEFLGASLRLVRFDPAHRRLSSLDWTGGHEAPNQFSDGYPVLVTSEASLRDLNLRLAAAGSPPAEMERFRPNIVLDGIEAHDEDRVDTLRICAADGEAHLQPAKPCPRCPIPNIDPTTAISSPEVGDALQAYRRDPRVGGAITFGMNTFVRQGAGQLLEVGQTVTADYRFD